MSVLPKGKTGGNNVDGLYSEKPAKVRHPPNAFLLFSKDVREGIKRQCNGLSPLDLSRLISQLWKNLDVGQKVQYQEKALKLAEKFNQENCIEIESPKEVKFQPSQRVSSKFPLLQPTEVYFQTISAQMSIDAFLSNIENNKVG